MCYLQHLKVESLTRWVQQQWLLRTLPHQALLLTSSILNPMALKLLLPAFYCLCLCFHSWEHGSTPSILCSRKCIMTIACLHSSFKKNKANFRFRHDNLGCGRLFLYLRLFLPQNQLINATFAQPFTLGFCIMQMLRECSAFPTQDYLCWAA